jgi:hypothetical protein
MTAVASPVKRPSIALRLAIFVAIALALLGAVVFALFRWWVGPTPESEAQKYADKQAPGVVEVIECDYAAEPEGSVVDRYYCVLHSDGHVRHPDGEPGIATITPGRRAYCFSIPRSGNPLHRWDGDAAPYYPARDVRECTGT